MISLIIPTTSKNKDYTSNLLQNIREIYPDESQVEIILEENDNVTLGVNYNNAVARATGEKIILLHNDMVLKPGLVLLNGSRVNKYNCPKIFKKWDKFFFNDIVKTPNKILDFHNDIRKKNYKILKKINYFQT